MSYPVAAGHPSSWSASPSGIVAVDKQSTDYTAIVTGVAPGSATVNCYIDGVAGGISVTVNGVRTLQSINLTPSAYSLYPGQQVQETPHFVDNYGATDKITPTPTVTWASDNQAIATVSSTGRVSASANPAASGIARIRATSGSITSSPAAITVIPKTVVPVTITGPAQPIAITGSYTWTANPQTTDAYTYVWQYLAAGSSTWQTVGTNSRTYTRALAVNDPDFTLRVTVSSVTRTGSATLFVNLGQPLEAPLGAAIDGPSFINQLGSYRWTAATAGGVAPLSYRWEINFLLRPTWGGIGTNSSSVSFMVSPDDGSFDLRLTVTSATGRQATVTSYRVNVTGGTGCETKRIC
jgi:hypothetical protein